MFISHTSYHIVSSRDKPTESKRKHLSAVPRTKKYRKPDSREGEGYHSRTNSPVTCLLVLAVCKWDHSDHLWNRAFSLPCQWFGALVHVLLWCLSLPESGGKDRKMMNMMTGAVAINGGVGVMEIRQPKMAEVAEQVSAIAADVAQNAHITLRELKEKIDAVVEQKLPTFKNLMEQKPVLVAQATVNDASLTVYENGYAVYEMDGVHTVMAVERCGDYRYDFTDGTYQIIPAEEFEEMEWSLRLLMEGERRMEHNRNKTSNKFENTALECDGSDWSAAVMVDFLDDGTAEVLADKELRRLYAAMSKLIERQSEIIQLYYYKGMSQYEIADELGIRQQSVDRILKQAVNRLRKNF
nr:MAG TPA: DNA directed RNA polymerase subunit [Bacteriophage sp.]